MPSWLHRLIDRVAGDPTADSGRGISLEEEKTRTHQTIMRTLSHRLETPEGETEAIEHSALVVILCASLARALELSEAERYILETAAQLHEVGMLAVPPALLTREAGLTPEELEQVRGQAKLSAEIAESMHHPRVARLIELQYEDYDHLAGNLPDPDLVLAGVLRVADVIAAVTRPRPYQNPLPPQERAQLLEEGAGTQFHPLAVEAALRLSGRR